MLSGRRQEANPVHSTLGFGASLRDSVLALLLYLYMSILMSPGALSGRLVSPVFMERVL